MVHHIDDAVVLAGPRLRRPVRPALHAVVLLPQLALHNGLDPLPPPHLGRLQRLPPQHVDQQQVEVLALVVLTLALHIGRPVDVALVVAVARLLRRVGALQVEALAVAVLLPSPPVIRALSLARLHSRTQGADVHGASNGKHCTNRY